MECDECGIELIEKSYYTIGRFNVCEECQIEYDFIKCNSDNCTNLIPLSFIDYDDYLCVICNQLFCSSCLHRKFNSYYCKKCYDVLYIN